MLSADTLFLPQIWFSYLKVEIFILYYQLLTSLIQLRLKVQDVLLFKGEETCRNHEGTLWLTDSYCKNEIIYFKILYDITPFVGQCQVI